MILMIDTADQKIVRVSLSQQHQLVDELSEENEFGSQVLLPLIKQLLAKNKLDFSDLTEIKVATGPGSFTGLRVGAAVAQALAYALNIPLNGHKGQPVELKYQ